MVQVAGHVRQVCTEMLVASGKKGNPWRTGMSATQTSAAISRRDASAVFNALGKSTPPGCGDGFRRRWPGREGGRRWWLAKSAKGYVRSDNASACAGKSSLSHCHHTRARVQRQGWIPNEKRT